MKPKDYKCSFDCSVSFIGVAIHHVLPFIQGEDGDDSKLPTTLNEDDNLSNRPDGPRDITIEEQGR